MKIQLTTMNGVAVGESLCAVDDDELRTDVAINDEYDASEQDWHEVVAMGNRTITLKYYNGETYTRPWTGDQLTWRLTDDEGEPIRADRW